MPSTDPAHSCPPVPDPPTAGRADLVPDPARAPAALPGTLEVLVTAVGSGSAVGAPAPDGPAAPAAPVSGLPSRAYAHDAGFDLAAAEDAVIEPLGRALVGTGTAIALPAGSVGLVCPRSGLATRHGVTVLNAPGIVDAGFRGELRVTLHNTDPHETFEVHRGDRIAQLVIVALPEVAFTAVEELPDSERGASGWGSSGGLAATASSKEQ